MSFAFPSAYVGASGAYSNPQRNEHSQSGVGSFANYPAAYSNYPKASIPAGRTSNVNSMEKGNFDGEFLTESTEISIRHNFLKKVFGLLTLCLLDAFGLCLAGNMIEGFRSWLLVNSWFPLVAAILMFVVSLVIICGPGVAEKVPLNFVLLFVYATATGCTFAGIGAVYDLDILVMAVGTTCAISLSCMLFACQVKYDFTKWYPYLMVGLLAMFTMSIVGLFLRVAWFQIVIGVFGTILFSCMLVMDTQMIVGGKRTRQYTIDQYILAVMTLFSDIINIFLYVLRIFSSMDN
eukprot:GHVH01000200.1.p1 GENE.GHVH01000200.1~~GHVH01000200.1.p1  ORF type:complete len:292 (-),score=24.32 GHVH01000200.1:57-932(-)